MAQLYALIETQLLLTHCTFGEMSEAALGERG